MRGEKGFTVVELFVAIGIFSLILVGLTIAFIEQHRMNDATQKSTEVQQTGRVTLDLIASWIRNAGARQGKNLSIEFVNAGGTDCDPTTTDDGTSDCITITTWDISRNQVLSNSAVDTTTNGATQPILQAIPSEFVSELQGISGDKFIGIRSRLALCHPSSSIACGTNPIDCTECGVVVEITSDLDTDPPPSDLNATVISHNFSTTAITSTNWNNIRSPVEVTIVERNTFSINTADNLLELNGQPIAEGVEDLQLVFTAFVPDGTLDGTTDGDPDLARVGVSPNLIFSDNTTGGGADLTGMEDGIRTAEIYIVVKSLEKSQKIRGGELPEKTIPGIGDVGARTFNDGLLHKLYSTTVYVRNLSREELG